LISFILLYRISHVICLSSSYKMRYAIYWFALGLILTVGHYNFFGKTNHWFSVSAPSIIILAFCLLFCVYGLYLMFSRSLLWLLSKHPAYRMILVYLLKKQVRNKIGQEI